MELGDFLLYRHKDGRMYAEDDKTHVMYAMKLVRLSNKHERELRAAITVGEVRTIILSVARPKH